MKRAVLAVIAIVVSRAAPCWAQLPDEEVTPAGELTGYFWKTLSSGEKTAFVYGFQAGYMYAAPSNQSAMEQARQSCLALSANPTPAQVGDCFAKSIGAQTEEYKRWDAIDPLPGGTYGETVEATDRFFAEPENRVMPIMAAWMITKWKREGRPQREIDKLVDDFRGTYIRAPRALCEKGLGTATRCKAVGTTLRVAPAK
jgi:hypothetical protein